MWPAGFAAAALLLGVLAAWWYARADLTLSHYDAKAHLVVARRIFDSLTPGWEQIGAVWLPLPHLLNALPVQVDALYRPGASATSLSVAASAAAVTALAWIVARATGSTGAAVVGAVAEECTGFEVTCPDDIAWDDLLCTEWCGLTQGFRKENTAKYLSSANGRQVCDEYFTTTVPSEVLTSCSDWTCIYNVFNAKGQAKDQTKIQMMALYLTTQYHESTVGDFYINCTKLQEECSASLPASCSGVDRALIDDVWSDLQDNPSAGLADCINNYNDAPCSLSVDYPDCEPGTFTGQAPAPKKISIRLT